MYLPIKGKIYRRYVDTKRVLIQFILSWLISIFVYYYDVIYYFMRHGPFWLQMIFTNQTFVQTWWRSIIMYVHFWGGICHFTQYNVSSSNTACLLQTILYLYYISISEKSIDRFYFYFDDTVRNYLHKEYKSIEDVPNPWIVYMNVMNRSLIAGCHKS